MRQKSAIIPDDLLPILQRADVNGNALAIREQLDRTTYERVNKLLLAMGGKWDRKARAHVFAVPIASIFEESLESGRVVNRKKTLGFFETPDALAQRVIDAANIQPHQRVLEPSAGHGALIAALPSIPLDITAVEIDDANAARLCERFSGDARVCVTHVDFLDFARSNRASFDRVIMNPPFADLQDAEHIGAALGLVKPGGRLVAISSVGPLHREDRKSTSFRSVLDLYNAEVERLPEGAFRTSGTLVNTALIVVDIPLDMRKAS